MDDRDDGKHPNVPRNPYTSSWSAERPEDARYDVPAAPTPEQRRERNAKKGIGAIVVAIGVLLAKFKGLLLLLLNLKYLLVFGKLLAYSWPFLLSLWLYVLIFGWRIGLVFLFVILVHEMGHYVAFRNYGLTVKLPVFIPLFGAFTAGAAPANLEEDAYIALAGPLTGLVLALACYGVAYNAHDQFWYAAAYVCAFLNLFQMIPTPPFDGGRVIGALSPQLWIAGFALFIALSVWLHVPLLFVIIIGVLGLPAVVAALRGHVDPRAATMTATQRVKVGAWYLAVLFALLYVMTVAHGSVSLAAMR